MIKERIPFSFTSLCDLEMTIKYPFPYSVALFPLQYKIRGWRGGAEQNYPVRWVLS